MSILDTFASRIEGGFRDLRSDLMEILQALSESVAIQRDIHQELVHLNSTPVELPEEVIEAELPEEVIEALRKATRDVVIEWQGNS